MPLTEQNSETLAIIANYRLNDEAKVTKMCETIEQYANQKVIAILKEMVRDGVISITEAARRANMSTDAFVKATA